MKTLSPIKTLFAMGFSVMMSGCAIAPLQSGAEKISVINTIPNSQCRFIGTVAIHDVNGESQAFTSHADLQQAQTNTLKNQALALKANVVVLSLHKTTYRSIKSYQSVDEHSMAGKAYLCPNQ
jgi:hypothetical protein